MWFCLPEMTRAIARQAEAERNRRAAIIQAEGERQAAEQLAQASEILTGTKGGLTLRMLRSLSEVSNSSNTTVLFPLPMELRDLLPGKDKTSGSEEKQAGQRNNGATIITLTRGYFTCATSG